MYLTSKIKNEIAEKLTNSFNINNVILFGSYAYGNPNADSDIDLLVILNDNESIHNYSDKIKKRVMISKSLIDIINWYYCEFNGILSNAKMVVEPIN
ncbi:MAG: nucleotidyltransferase domain-containing protein [Bacteroidales bacterium]|nr:nucleotidyltransferase domain-containing protein [Bacteroidales bacterium]